MKSKKKKSNIIQPITGLFLFCHFMVVAALIFSLLAGIIPPDKLWIFSFFGLVYLPVYIANIGFTAIWILLRRKYWLLSLIPLVLGFMIFRGHFNINFHGEQAKKTGDIKVMTFNVRSFQPTDGFSHDEFMRKSFANIEKEHPDIICFQEYNLPDEGKFGLEGLKRRLGLPYSANSMPESNIKKNNITDVNILSRYPVMESKHFDFNSGYSCQYADILYRNQTIRVICIHLQSYMLYTEEKVILHAPRTFTNFDENRISHDSRKIAWKLRWALKQRAPEARNVADFVSKSPYPVILCGDFNDTPASYAYRTISKSLEDPFPIYGNGIARTYNESKYPFRIDYILYSDRFSSLDYHVIPTKLSDHNPVTSILRMK
ncbi:MAG: endonuclease/exonuclease/phosphatase family protein [Bacteroidota bacterium]|nr:endonuclease/exonuclease/phosphatase family protein [Bacteroidota bacterium]